MAEVQSIQQVLQTQGVYVGVVSGDSMQPMLDSRTDTVVVKAKTHRLSVGDVALFNNGENYVLHRVIAVHEGGYLARGDNRFTDEWVEEAEVLGVLTEFYKDEKRISCQDKRYMRYAKNRLRFYALRRFAFRVKNKLKRPLSKK